MNHNHRLPSILLTLLVCFFYVSCEKDEPTTLEQPNDPMGIEGRFSNFITCDVIAVPTEVSLSSYYTKYINCSGVPIIGSDAVPDEALLLASETVEFMLLDLGNVRAKLIEDGNYVALVPEGGNLSDLPENFIGGPNSTGAYSNGPNLKAAASDVASLLCNPDVGYGHTLVHEMAHMIDGGALRFLNNNYDAELQNIYNQAMSEGKWNNTYASTNFVEYLAEGVTIWYGVNWIGPEGGDGNRNNIGTRADLQSYDSRLYNFINTHYNAKTDMPGCRTPVIKGATTGCPSTVTDIDGNVYAVVTIGPMCWMQENLKTTRFNDGTPIPNVTEETEWANTNQAAWAEYDNDTNLGEIYGKLYNGFALGNTKNICPEGWHVPSFQELQDLANYAGGDYAAVNLRATELWNPPGLPATNSSGFTALPSGIRLDSGAFIEYERRANFGSTTSLDMTTFYSKSIYGDQSFVFTQNATNNHGMPCRCIMD